MYRQGDVAWGFSRGVMLAVGVAAAAAILALVTYRGLAAAARTRDRIVLVGLRLAALAILVDDSRSMAIADRNGETRSAFIQQQLSGPNAKLYQELSSRFVLRLFSFSSSATRVSSTHDLKYGGTATHVGQALERARDEQIGRAHV